MLYTVADDNRVLFISVRITLWIAKKKRFNTSNNNYININMDNEKSTMLAVLQLLKKYNLKVSREISVYSSRKLTYISLQFINVAV